MVGERGFEPPTPGPETKEISQGVDFSIHVSGASTVQTHVIPARRAQSFSYGCPGVGAPNSIQDCPPCIYPSAYNSTYALDRDSSC